jgi:hypothetical protein
MKAASLTETPLHIRERRDDAWILFAPVEPGPRQELRAAWSMQAAIESRPI